MAQDNQQVKITPITEFVPGEFQYGTDKQGGKWSRFIYTEGEAGGWEITDYLFGEEIARRIDEQLSFLLPYLQENVDEIKRSITGQVRVIAQTDLEITLMRIIPKLVVELYKLLIKEFKEQLNEPR